jgi:hypothetical protein
LNYILVTEISNKKKKIAEVELAKLCRGKEKHAAKYRYRRNFMPRFDYTQLLFKSPIHPRFSGIITDDFKLEYRPRPHINRLANMINDLTNVKLDKARDEYEKDKNVTKP